MHELISENHAQIYGSIDDGTQSSSPPVFVLCDTCYWSATYFDKKRIPVGNCPQCNYYSNNRELTNFPIMSDESFAFCYNDKSGVELEFKRRLQKAISWNYSFFACPSILSLPVSIWLLIILTYSANPKFSLKFAATVHLTSNLMISHRWLCLNLRHQKEDQFLILRRGKYYQTEALQRR